MKIVNLHVENIKRIKAVDVTPKGNTVVISGKNGNGKSSTIDSIAMALGGKKLIPSEALRKGEEKGKITLDLGDYIVTRNWTGPQKSYLTVTNKDGAKFGNAQTILDRLIGELSFDPLAFTTMESKKRLELLKNLAGIDFSSIDKEIEEAMVARRDYKRDGEKLKARIETEYSNLDDLPDSSTDIEETKKKKEEAESHNKKVSSASMELNNVHLSIESNKNEIEYFEKQIKEFQSQIAKKKDIIAMAEDRIKEIEDVAKMKMIDVSEFQQLERAHFNLEGLKQRHATKDKLEQELNEIRDFWASEDDKITDLRDKKKKLLEESNMPIDGLGLGDGEVLFNDIPFSNLSTAEQIRISMSISIAMNPRLKVAMIYNGSLLDSESMKEIEKMAQEKDFQIWIEKVADTPDGNSIYIEDGEVVE